MPADILIVPNRNSTTLNPNIQFSGSAVNTIRLEAQSSGSVAFVGNSGSLFSVVDNLSGSLMAVSDVSGLPILEVFSDDRVVMGKFNSNTLVVTGSRVGIGKATPNAAFDVSGSAIVSGSLNVTSSLTVIGTTNFYGVVNSFNTQNSVNIYSSLSTNIGVGALDASVDIGVNRSANGNAYLNFVSDTATYPFYGLLVARLSGANGKSQLIHRGTGDFEIKANEAAAISLQTSATEKVRITSGGNVGIATSSPGQKLDVIGRMRFRSDGTVSAGAWYTDSGGTENVFVGQTGTTATSAFGVFSNSGWRFAILNGGNVGIGTITPSAKLNIYSDVADATFKITPAGASLDGVIQITGEGDDITLEGLEMWYQNTTGDAHISTTFTGTPSAIRFHTRVGASKSTSNERFTIYGDGNIGINKATPTAKLDVNGNVIVTGSFTVWNDNVYIRDSVLNIASGAANGMFIRDYTNSVFRGYMIYNNNRTSYFSTSGSAGITNGFSWGTSINDGAMDLNGSGSLLVSGSLSVGNIARSATSGEIRASNNITAYYSSDERLKTNIIKIDNPLDKIKQIDGVLFDWNDIYKKQYGEEDGYFIRKQNSGIIAQQVEKVFPNVVADRQDGYKAVRYELLVPLLIEAIKEQQVRIDELEKQLINKQ